MKIALIGITGKIGMPIAEAALRRGHEVTAIVRRKPELKGSLGALPNSIVDLFDHATLTDAIRGHDVLASAYGPAPEAISSLLEVTKALIAAARGAGIKRVLVVGGAGSLEVAPGVQLVDAPTFPEMYRPYALAHREALGLLRAADDLDWTFFAPAAEIGPGDKIGHFRIAAGKLITNASGRSQISYADYADAFVSEIENGVYRQQIVTAAY